MVNELELKKAIKEYLQNDLPEEIKAETQRLEMELASPGDWEAAKYESDPTPDAESTVPIE